MLSSRRSGSALAALAAPACVLSVSAAPGTPVAGAVAQAGGGVRQAVAHAAAAPPCLPMTKGTAKTG